MARFPDMDRTQRDLLEEALRFYQGFVQEDDPDPAARAETAKAHALMAKVHGALSRTAEAERAARKGLDALGRLAVDFPADRAHRAGLADLHHWWGSYLGTNRDQPSAARDHLIRAVDLYEGLAAEEAPFYRARLAAAYRALAYHHTRSVTGDGALAERLYRQAINLQEQPDAAGWIDHAGLASTCNSLGLLLRLKERPAAAEPLHRRAVDHSGRAAAHGEQARATTTWLRPSGPRAGTRRRSRTRPRPPPCARPRPINLPYRPSTSSSWSRRTGTWRECSGSSAAGRRRSAQYDQAVRQADQLLRRFPERPHTEQEWMAMMAAIVQFSARLTGRRPRGTSSRCGSSNRPTAGRKTTWPGSW